MPDRDPPPPGRSSRRSRSHRPPTEPAESLEAVPYRRHRSRSSRKAPSHGSLAFVARGAAALIAVMCLGAALGLAAHHPAWPWAAAAGALMLVAVGRFFWMMVPGWSLGLVPWLGFAPITGWLLVEEIDLALLALAAGAYLAISGPHRSVPSPVVAPARRALRWSRGTAVLMALALASGTASVLHGLGQWPNWPDLRIGWFDGYLEPGATLRVAKPLVAVLLLLPLWARVARRRPDQVVPSVLGGATLALLGCSLPALAERWTFTGLLNFSSDYRVTGPFWEMHVGGAALDGALALTLPLALLMVLRAGSTRTFVLGAGVLLLGGYVALVTFSRGVYLALAVSLPLMAALMLAQRRRVLALGADDAAPTTRTAALALAFGPPLAVFVLASAWLFGGSGYRGLAALFLSYAALVMQPPPAQAAHWRRTTVVGAVLAVPVLTLLGLASVWIPKLPYVAAAGLAAASMGLALAGWRGRLAGGGLAGDAVRAGTWLALLGSVGLVAGYWGGSHALAEAVVPLLLLALTWAWCQHPSVAATLADVPLRHRSGGVAVLLVALAVVAALAGGAYVEGRVATTSTDLVGRTQHWRHGLAALEAQNRVLWGAGAGRFVPVFAQYAPADDLTGDYRLQAGPPPALHLRAGTHMLGHGELLRVAQRIDAAPPGLVLRLQVQADAPQRLQAEVCLKHLIYTGGCRSREMPVPATAGLWQDLEVRLPEGVLPDAPLVFSVAAASAGGEMSVRQLSLKGADGRELLRNGDFRRDLAHWFPTSDRHHLPWHAKSLPLHLLFEQGAVGLSVAGLLLAVALARLTLGEARDHPLAPALVAALVGFAVVGLFDSLVDAPRIAFLSMSLLLVGLGLRHPPRAAAS